MYYLLTYDYVDNIVERRAPYRENHLSLVGECVERGELVLAGAYADPVDGALLVFRVDERSQVEEFIGKDPYVKNGLVVRWRIREWTVVAGTAM